MSFFFVFWGNDWNLEVENGVFFFMFLGNIRVLSKVNSGYVKSEEGK